MPVFNFKKVTEMNRIAEGAEKGADIEFVLTRNPESESVRWRKIVMECGGTEMVAQQRWPKGPPARVRTKWAVARASRCS